MKKGSCNVMYIFLFDLATGYCLKISSQIEVAWLSYEQKCKVIFSNSPYSLCTVHGSKTRPEFLNTEHYNRTYLCNESEIWKPKPVP